VRNLGFEDEPDYNYLRDLFTQALKNTGEQEDGIYDWMKLNDGKGWEALKTHPSAAHLQHVQNSSNREAHRGKTQIPQDRLNADLPKQPGASRNAQPLAARAQRRTGDTGYGSDPALASKRGSAQQDFRHPEGSTAAQFQSSNPAIPIQTRGIGLQNGPQATSQSPQGAPKPGQEEPRPSAWQRFMKIFCCGK
jgi:casein kinase 1